MTSNCSILTDRPTVLVLRTVGLVFVFLALAGIELLLDQRSSLTVLIGELAMRCEPSPPGYRPRYLSISFNRGRLV